MPFAFVSVALRPGRRHLYCTICLGVDLSPWLQVGRPQPIFGEDYGIRRGSPTSAPDAARPFSVKIFATWPFECISLMAASNASLS